MHVYRRVDLEWSAAGNTGAITATEGNVPYPVLGLPAGGGATNPETLLLAAVASCYSITLSNVLQAASLPQTHVSVHAEGIIASDSDKARFTRVTVSPTIRGADILRRRNYEKAGIAARDECLIGRAIRGNVAYVVGEVLLLRAAG